MGYVVLGVQFERLVRPGECVPPPSLLGAGRRHICRGHGVFGDHGVNHGECLDGIVPLVQVVESGRVVHPQIGLFLILGQRFAEQGQRHADVSLRPKNAPG